jgi:hypothetical protein
MFVYKTLIWLVHCYKKIKSTNHTAGIIILVFYNIINFFIWKHHVFFKPEKKVEPYFLFFFGQTRHHDGRCLCVYYSVVCYVLLYYSPSYSPFLYNIKNKHNTTNMERHLKVTMQKTINECFSFLFILLKILNDA